MIITVIVQDLHVRHHTPQSIRHSVWWVLRGHQLSALFGKFRFFSVNVFRFSY